VNARHLRERVLDERVRAGVLQPLDPVVRLHNPIVERIAMGEEHVEVPVAVQIDQLDA
jgi:hypothetical protein